jgi:hypothetical protein
MEPSQYVRKLEGKSNAHLITFNDGKDYVVKFLLPGFEKTLPNEWVAYCLARFLGLPIPFAQIVEIPPNFSSQIPELGQWSSSKFQFASRYVPACIDGHQLSSANSITNHHTLAGIILFDYWLCNQDRTRKNILLSNDSTDGYKMWVIDHAEVFGSYHWNLKDLEQLPSKPELMKSAAHQFMACFIENEKDFYEQLELIETIPILLIEEIVSLIPDDWIVSADERKAIVATLLYRRKKVLPKLMERFIKRVYRPLKKG